MGITGWVSVAVLLFAAPIARADDCISADEMQSIASHFTQFRELAGRGAYCFDDSPTSHLLRGLMFMRQTRFAADMPNSADELFSGTFKRDWYSYIAERINQFTIQTSCDPGVAAWVYYWNTAMYVCPMALTNAMTGLDLASVFMHEARHIDGYPHIRCTRGPRAGVKGACDQRISDRGSYAVSVETYAQIARYAPDLHPAMRAYARNMALVYADEAFETPTRIARTSRFLAVTADRRFHALDLAAGTSAPLGTMPVAGRVALRAQSLVLIPDDKDLPSRFVFTHDEGETAQTLGDMMSFYDKGTPATRAEFVDVHSGYQWFALVLRDRVRFNCGLGAVPPVELRLDEVPTGFVYPDGYSRESKSALLIAQSGRVYEVGCPAFVRAQELRFDRPYKRVYKVGADTLGLDASGRLYRLDEAGNGVALGFAEPVVELVPNQVVDFLDAVE